MEGDRPQSPQVLEYQSPSTRGPSLLVRVLAPAPTYFSRVLPWVALVLIAYGSIFPGWTSGYAQVGCCCAIASLLGSGIHCLIAFVIRRYRDEWLRVMSHAAVLALAGFLLLNYRPLMHAAFWISRPVLERKAQEVLNMPFTSARSGPGSAGLFNYAGISRCPHGVFVHFTLRSQYGNGTELASGCFFYRDSKGNCEYEGEGTKVGQWRIR